MNGQPPARPVLRNLTLIQIPNLPVIRELMVDMTRFYAQYISIKPWLSNHELAPERERLQSLKERDRLKGLYECILCGCCASQCPKGLVPSRAIESIRLILLKEAL